jgi:hypothetical protein
MGSLTNSIPNLGLKRDYADALNKMGFDLGTLQVVFFLITVQNM